jgi:hypothetical protein
MLLFHHVQAKVDAPLYIGMQLCVKGSGIRFKNSATTVVPKQRLLDKISPLNSNTMSLAYSSCRKASLKVSLQAPTAEIVL